MSIKNNNVILSLSLTVLLTIMFFTDPNSLPVYFFMIPFICLFLVLLTSANLISKKTLPAGNKINIRKRRFIIVTFSLIVTMLVALQSIGQLTARDLITVAVLSAISIFYINRSSFAK